MPSYPELKSIGNIKSVTGPRPRGRIYDINPILTLAGASWKWNKTGGISLLDPHSTFQGRTPQAPIHPGLLFFLSFAAFSSSLSTRAHMAEYIFRFVSLLIFFWLFDFLLCQSKPDAASCQVLYLQNVFRQILAVQPAASCRDIACRQIKHDPAKKEKKEN